MPAAEPPPDCSLCSRLAAFRYANTAAFPHHHNRPVASLGSAAARLLIVGLAPGLHGGNRTGRPFTGDAAGAFLFAALQRCGLAQTAGEYPEPSACRITNAVRCAPPQNRPASTELRACRPFLDAEITGMANLRAILALGRTAHDAVLAALGIRRAAHPFRHGAAHRLDQCRTLFDSYHCSRYNVNTRRLTPPMFEAVLARVRREIETPPTSPRTTRKPALGAAAGGENHDRQS